MTLDQAQVKRANVTDFQLAKDFRLSASLVETALALHSEALRMDKGRARATATWGARVLRLYADQVMRDLIDREVARAYLDAGRLIVKGIRNARSH